MRVMIEPDDWLARWLTVEFDGQDVTRRCVLADEERGKVVLNKLDARGHFYREGQEIAREIKSGQVILKIREDINSPALKQKVIAEYEKRRLAETQKSE